MVWCLHHYSKKLHHKLITTQDTVKSLTSNRALRNMPVKFFYHFHVTFLFAVKSILNRSVFYRNF